MQAQLAKGFPFSQFHFIKSKRRIEKLEFIVKDIVTGVRKIELNKHLLFKKIVCFLMFIEDILDTLIKTLKRILQ